MLTLSHTVREAFLLGARIHNLYDYNEQIVTVGDNRPWRLSNSEWWQMLVGVQAVSQFLSSVCGSIPRQPLPTPETMRTFMPHGAGGEFWLLCEGRNAQPLSADDLEFWIRHTPELGFAHFPHGPLAMTALSHEVWADVIIPAIERGEIAVTVWGEPL